MRSVVHWDGDGFFASVEQAADHRLRGRPVAVGGVSRGVVLSASREARRYGIRPGLAMGKARRACRRLVVVPAHFELYEQFSRQIVGLCEERTPLVEPLAVGAAYLDLTGTRALLRADAAQVAGQLQCMVNDWLHVFISTGIASSKTVARIAARRHKPGGHVTVPAGEEARFLAPLPLDWLPGLGEEKLATLQVAGLTRIGDLARAPVDALALVLGKRTLALQRLAQGVDEEPVRPPRDTEEPQWREVVDFPEDMWDEALLLRALREMLERLMAKVRAAEVEVRRLTLGLRYTDRDEAAKSVTLAEPASVETDFFPHLPGLLRAAWGRRVRLRALSLQASRVYRPAAQMPLFGPPPKKAPVQLALAIDHLRREFGERAVIRGYQLAG